MATTHEESMTNQNQNPNGPWGQPPQQQQWGQQQPQQQWGAAEQAQWQAQQHAAWAAQQQWARQQQQQAQAQWQPDPNARPDVQARDGISLNQQQAQFFTRVYGWMFMGLGLTAVIAWVTFASGLWRTLAPMFMPLMLVELGLVWFLSARINTLSPPAAIGSFLGYAALNGLTLSVIFVIYSLGSIGVTFLATALMFGFMFALGLATKKDLSGFGSMLTMMLVGLVIASLVNVLASTFGWFPKGNQLLYWGITYVGIFVFAGLTAWDAQRLKLMSANGFNSEANLTRASVMGALQLYLDFINLFLMLLRILGSRRD
jgi:FtsH-binding integral membrane protein